jgi:histidine triad (HIT) family protein
MSYDDQNIFAKILRGEVPADVVYEDDRCLAFRDIDPLAPTHVLVIPKAPCSRVSECGPEDAEALGHLMWAAGEVARREGLEDFRIVINDGSGAGQAVFHVHLHVIGGRALKWPPG